MKLSLRWPWQRKAEVAGPLDLLREMLGGYAAKAGVAVNYNTALQAATALACARVISEGLAQVPFRLMKKTGRERLPAEDHPLYDLLGQAPNDWQTSFELREMMGLHLAFGGNFYAFKSMLGGRVLELLPYAPNQVTVKRKGWESTYQLQGQDGRIYEVDKSGIWHVRGISWDGVKGLDGIRLAREAIGLAMATEEHGARQFSNGALIRGFLSGEAIPQDKAVRDEMRNDWQEMYSGLSNAAKTAVLWGGLKFQTVSSDNDKSQYLETRRFQVEEVCRFFRVMPIMVGFSDKTATYASAEQMFVAHVVHTLMPWYARIEQSANVNLLTKEERKAGYYFKFFAQGLMRGAMKDRAEFYRVMHGTSSINPNDIRELEDMNPYEGGDEYFYPGNMLPVSDVGEDNGQAKKFVESVVKQVIEAMKQ